MKIHKLEVKQTLSKIIEIKAISIDEAILKVSELNINGDFDLLNNNDVDLDTKVDFHQLSELELGKDFDIFIRSSVMKVIDRFSVQDLSKFAYGNISNAINKFKNNKN